MLPDKTTFRKEVGESSEKLARTDSLSKRTSSRSTEGRRSGTSTLRIVQENGGHVNQINCRNRDKLIGLYNRSVHRTMDGKGCRNPLRALSIRMAVSNPLIILSSSSKSQVSLLCMLDYFTNSIR